MGSGSLEVNLSCLSFSSFSYSHSILRLLLLRLYKICPIPTPFPLITFHIFLNRFSFYFPFFTSLHSLYNNPSSLATALTLLLPPLSSCPCQICLPSQSPLTSPSALLSLASDFRCILFLTVISCYCRNVAS